VLHARGQVVVLVDRAAQCGDREPHASSAARPAGRGPGDSAGRCPPRREHAQGVAHGPASDYYSRSLSAARRGRTPRRVPCGGQADASAPAGGRRPVRSDAAAKE
jgi:hypothetical protein